MNSDVEALAVMGTDLYAGGSFAMAGNKPSVYFAIWHPLGAVAMKNLLGTWDGQGVFYKDSISGNWVMMATPADQVTAGDLDGDGTDDLIGIWAGQAGVWAKYSATGNWAYIGSSARDIATGKMTGGIWGNGLSADADLEGPGRFYKSPSALDNHVGAFSRGPSRFMKYEDVSSTGPGGNRFIYEPGTNLVPRRTKSEGTRIPGPGEAGFRCVVQRNLWPPAEARK